MNTTLVATENLLPIYFTPPLTSSPPPSGLRIFGELLFDHAGLLTMCHTTTYTCQTPKCKYFYEDLRLCAYCSERNLRPETCTRRLGVFSYRRNIKVYDGDRHYCNDFRGISSIRRILEIRCKLSCLKLLNSEMRS